MRIAVKGEILINELRVIFIARVTSYFLHMSYELLFLGEVMSYFLNTSNQLLFIA